MRWGREDGYAIDTDPERLDLDAIHAFLADAYWSKGLQRDVLERSIAGSLSFGVYAPDGTNVGFARVVTDRATFAWVGDVFVLPEHRGRGLGVWLMESIASHPELQGLRRWMLATRDAHELYRKTGYVRLDETGDTPRYMIRRVHSPPAANAERTNLDGGQ
jgi:GNAT superfamily N-acetyltransferase